jgi:hypothetical protein
MTRRLRAMSENTHLDHFTDQTMRACKIRLDRCHTGLTRGSLAAPLDVGKLSSKNVRHSREVRVLASHGVTVPHDAATRPVGGTSRPTVLLRWNFRDLRRVLSCRAVKDRTDSTGAEPPAAKRVAGWA